VAVTLADLRSEVAGELGLDNTASSDDQVAVDRWLNRGVRDVLRKTHCYTDQITVTPGAVSEYTLASTVLEIVDLAIQNQDPSPERLSAHEVRRRQRLGTSSTTIHGYAFSGNNLLLFYPTLGASTVLDLLVVPAPTAMSAAGNDVTTATYGGVPDDYVYLVELYAKAQLASRRDDKSSAQGQRYREWYREGVAEARKELVRKGGRVLPRATVGRRKLVPSDPSADWRW
jgi:hypothetical protein